MRPIKVLVVEDSSAVREFLIHLFQSDPELQVIGTARDGEEALEVVRSMKPDVITMDIHMPKLDGFEATRRIMETYPTPIVIVSGSLEAHEVATTFGAVEAGALAAVPRPPGFGHPAHAAAAKQLLQTVKLMSEVKVVRRWARLRRESTAPLRPPAMQSVGRRPQMPEIKLVAIGASTGGPVALQTILSALPKNFPAPVAIVQHMAAGFAPGFAEWLTQTTGRPAHVAAHGEALQPGRVYLAPDGFQMRVEKGGVAALIPDEPENGLRPAVSYFFRSVAEVYGPSAVGVLLSGMGKDGAQELKLMRDKGAVTLAQDEASSVVHGMPGEAIRLEAAAYVLSPRQMASVLAELVKQH